MGLNDTPSGERIHIGFFGCTNAGKSSLVNAFTGQNLSVVSDTKGTTTDPVTKAMELLPLGPVLIIDTPGLDDKGELGLLRVQKAKQMLRKTDVAILVADATLGLTDFDKDILNSFKQANIPYVIAYNKSDLLSEIPQNTDNSIYVSALTNTGVHELKEKIAHLAKFSDESKKILADFIKKGDTVLFVTPIDESAPKARLILPVQMALRDVLDAGAVGIITKEPELEKALNSLKNPPSLVVTDSQVFGYVSKIVPKEIPLTSFSILMARYKGFLKCAVNGVRALSTLKDGDNILIAEGCTHHRQCNDIGSVKIPAWLKQATGKNLNISVCSGTEFPDDLSKYALIIHCGGCMLPSREVIYRMRSAMQQNVPFTNYGTFIAHINNILERSIEILSHELK